MLRASRDSRGEDRFFAIKTILLVLAASLGLAGMMYKIEWMVWAAIAVVAAAIILRLIADRNRTDND